MRLTEASAKFGPLKLTLNNPTQGQAMFLWVSGIIVSMVLLIVAAIFFVANVVALVNGTGDVTHNVTWATVLGLYLVNAVSG